MSDLDDTDETGFARELMGRLAATMPDNPGRTSSVQRRVRRRHQRRVAARASVGLTMAAGVGLVVAVGSRERTSDVRTAAPQSTVGTADATTTTASSTNVESSCPSPVDADSDRSDGALLAYGQIKATGTITALDGDTITISTTAASIDTAAITATLLATTNYTMGATTSTDRPPLAIGGSVAFSASTQPDGSYSIDHLEMLVTDGADVAATDSSDPQTKTLAPGQSSSEPDSEARIKATGAITALDGDTISISVEQASSPGLTDLTATIASDAMYADGGATSTIRPTLTIGEQVVVSVIPQESGAYVLDQLAINADEVDPQNSAGPKGTDDMSAEDAAKAASIAACTDGS